MTPRSSLLLLGLLAQAACPSPPQKVRPEELRSTVPGTSTLVVVYSRTGHTAEMARAFADELGADYLRLQGTGKEGGSWFTARSCSSIRSKAVACRPPSRAEWRDLVSSRGGQVLDVVGINRKKLSERSSIAAEARRMVTERRRRGGDPKLAPALPRDK